MKNTNYIIKSKEDLVKQVKFKNIVDISGEESIIIKGRKDKKIKIIENLEHLEIYKKNEGVFSLMEHIETGNREPFTTGLLFGGGLKDITISNIKIINYGNQCINLLISGIDSIGNFTYEKLFFPFFYKRDFEYLLCLYNQKRTNIYISTNNKLKNIKKIKNQLYLNEELGNILLSINPENFINDLSILNLLKQKIQTEIIREYDINDFIRIVGNKDYFFINSLFKIKTIVNSKTNFEYSLDNKNNKYLNYNNNKMDLLNTTYVYL